MVTLALGIFFTPELESLVRIYLISVVAFITTIVNLLFRLETIRKKIVQKIVADVMSEIFKDDDIRDLIAKKHSSGNR